MISEQAKSHFLNLYSIALSDTQIDSTELLLLYQFGQNKGVEREKIEALLLNADKVTFTIPEDVVTKIKYLYEFALMIWADGKIDEFEVNALHKFCFKFGFKSENVKELSDFLLDEAKQQSEIDAVIKKVNKILRKYGD
ncbi:MAG: hypothetical protein WD016_10940 [Balneolaceae bacterium]